MGWPPTTTVTCSGSAFSPWASEFEGKREGGRVQGGRWSGCGCGRRGVARPPCTSLHSPLCTMLASQARKRQATNPTPKRSHPPHAPPRGQQVARRNEHSGAVGSGAKHARQVGQELLIGCSVGGALRGILWQVGKAAGQRRLLASRALALWEAALGAAVGGGLEGRELLRVEAGRTEQQLV